MYYLGYEMPAFEYSKSVMGMIFPEVFIEIGLGRGGREKEMEVGILSILFIAG